MGPRVVAGASWVEGITDRCAFPWLSFHCGSLAEASARHTPLAVDLRKATVHMEVQEIPESYPLFHYATGTQMDGRVPGS